MKAGTDLVTISRYTPSHRVCSPRHVEPGYSGRRHTGIVRPRFPGKWRLITRTNNIRSPQCGNPSVKDVLRNLNTGYINTSRYLTLPDCSNAFFLGSLSRYTLPHATQTDTLTLPTGQGLPASGTSREYRHRTVGGGERDFPSPPNARNRRMVSCVADG